jgi:transcriptional regulator with XRE-family HTH domain
MNEAALETVARNVRAARAAAGLSLDALAARADVSKGALVGLEGGRGNPNFTTLVRLADALGRPVSWLLEDSKDEAAPVVVVQAAGVEPLWTGAAGGSARLLLTVTVPPAPAAPVELWRWVLHPGERRESAAHPAGTVETLTVVRGAMRLVVGAGAAPEPTALRAGASASFAADVAHAYEGAGRGPCELLMTVHLPLERRA